MVPMQALIVDMQYLVYAILPFPVQFAPLAELLAANHGIGHSKLETVSSAELIAITGKVNHQKVISSTENALAYARVIDELFRLYTLLPVRYGTVANSREAVVSLLKKHTHQLHQNLDEVKNREEFSLKMLWKHEGSYQYFRGQPGAAKKEVPIPFPADSPQKTYLLQKIRKHRQENALVDYAEQLANKLEHWLVSFHPTFRFKIMVSQRLILDATMLIKKGYQQDVVQAISCFQDRYPDLHFLLTGPWPPYNFVKLPNDGTGQKSP